MSDSVSLRPAHRGDWDKSLTRAERLGHPITIDVRVVSRQYLSILRRRWLTILLVFLAVVSGVVGGTLLQTPTYRATGLLEVRSENTGQLPVETLFNADRMAVDSLATQIGVLRSATLAERVVRAVDFEGAAEPVDPTVPAIPAFASGPVRHFQARLSVDPIEGSRLVRVSFESSDPKEAADAVNTVFTVYTDLRKEDAQRSAVLLSAQLEDAKGRLDKAQHRLQDYVREHGLQVLETGKGETESLINNRLRQLQEQLATAQMDRYQRQSVAEYSERSGAKDIASPVIQDLTVRLADLQREEAKLAVTFRDDYPKLQETRQQIASLQRTITEESNLGANEAQRDYQRAQRRESLLQGALASEQQRAQGLSAQTAGYAPLKLEVETNERLFSALDQKLKEVEVSAALRATTVGVVDPASPPPSPSSPDLPLNAAVGVMVGLLAGVGGAFAKDRFDGRIRTVSDVDDRLGVRALATIPSFPTLPSGLSRGALFGKSDVVDVLEPSGKRAGVGPDPARQWYRLDQAGSTKHWALNEAFASLGTAVLLNDDVNPPRTLLVTSSLEGEGKTTVSINLALALARLNKRVLLIDCDLRRPSVHDALGMPARQGLVSFLTGEASTWRTLVASTDLPTLDVLTAGRVDERAPQLLSSPAMATLVAGAASDYDFVIIDSPPLLSYRADVRILASLTDGALLTVRGNSTALEVVEQSLAQLNRVLGVILNGSSEHQVSRYYRA